MFHNIFGGNFSGRQNIHVLGGEVFGTWRFGESEGGMEGKGGDLVD